MNAFSSGMVAERECNVDGRVKEREREGVAGKQSINSVNEWKRYSARKTIAITLLSMQCDAMR